MAMFQIRGRLWRVALASALVLIIGSFTAMSARSAEEGGSAVFYEETPVAPDGEDVHKAAESAEASDRERRAWLGSPDAVREREISRRAFVGIGAERAKALVRSVFAKELAALDSDPARVLSDAQFAGPATASVATIREDDKTTLLDAGIPVRDEDEGGDIEKVDLSLEATGEGFEPANPLVEELIIPDSAARPIQLGDEGLEITAQGVADQDAQRLGDQDIYFNSVLPDTGYMVAPIAGGVELFNVLYSEESPETLHYGLELPEGAHLSSDGRGGAQIVRDGEQLAYIPFPTAVDAQGTRVPVEMQLDGSSLDLHVPHRAGDYAMPILVDPAIYENHEATWYWGSDLRAIDPFPGVWDYKTNDPTQAWFVRGTSCLTGDLCSPSTRGLFMFTHPKNFPANIWGHFWYWAPGATTYIPSIYPEPSAAINPFWRNNHGCSWNQYPRPYDYNGSFDANGNWLWHEIDRAQWYGHAVMYTRAKGIAFGMSTGSGGWTPCHRSIMVGGVAVRLDDEDAPVLHSAAVPAGWVGDNNPFTASAYGSDGSLGFHRVRVTPDGRPHFEHWLGCLGTAVNRCPNAKSEQMAISADRFAEGERPVHFAALDPTTEPVSNTITKTIKVDTTAPQITLSGQLAEATSEVGNQEKPPGEGDQLVLPVYNLRIFAKDYEPNATGANKRSGVQNIRVFLNEVEQPPQWQPQSCTPDGGCPATMEKVYKLVLTKLLTAGKHKLEVVAIDQVGEELKRTIEFEYFPATGMKDEYVLQRFPLPDGSGDETEEEQPSRPELAVNVMNGNLVYRETDVDVESAAGIDLEVDRYYNSMLPDSENGELGDGWTFGQTPKLEPEQTVAPNPPKKAKMLRSSAAFESEVSLPTASGATRFNPQLNAAVKKLAAGGYEISDETGEAEASTVFDANGRVIEQRSEGYAKAVYDYEGGNLDAIEVRDPATFTADPANLRIEPIPTPRFERTFGTFGSGDGQLRQPADVAVDAAGNIWVADRINSRIQKFSASGQFLGRFGSPGSGPGQFQSPAALAIDPKGNIWVAEKGTGRVQKFNANGEFLLQFGSKGTGQGQFAAGGPEGIAVDTKGNVWVSDTYGGRLQKFNEAGAFIKSVGAPGSGPGQLDEPAGIDVGARGEIWVAEWGNNRVSVFSEAGEFIRQFGSHGSGDGQFEGPDAIDVDSQGNVWVGEAISDRIQQFDEHGNFVTRFGGAGSGPGRFNFTYPFGITTDPKGALLVADVNNHRVQQFQIPHYLPSFHSSFGGAGAGGGQFNRPADVELDSRGNLWVVDQLNHRIQKFDPSGEFISQFGSSGSGNGQLDNPASMAIDTNGDIWIADKANNRIQKFNANGEFMAKLGTAGSGQGQLSGPEDIAVDANGDIWVADTGNHRIQEFSASGVFLRVVNPAGMGPIEPVGIEAGPGGRVWVTDSASNRVVVLSEPGVFLRQFGAPGSGPGQFNRPGPVEVNGKGMVWVGDSGNGRIQQFNQFGDYVTQFGAKGSGAGQFSLDLPFGIAVGARGRVWVADRNNNRIQRWEPSDLTPTETRIPVDGDDPLVDVKSEGGLVTSMQGEEAGAHTFGYNGNFLVFHNSPEGQVNYERDAEGRLRKVTLANGTWGKVEYRSADGRVASVTVDPAGTAPASRTQFEYSDAVGPQEARSTKVIPEGAPHITYDIGADGSVLKWWHVPQPPKFIDISGSLWVERERLLTVGDHFFKVVADSPEGIASIRIIANGGTVVSEQTCPQTEDFGIECQRVEDEWVVGTYELPPGLLHLEAVVTGRNPDEVESERFWVDVPHTPPPPAGEPAPPRFKDILRFREEYGLEVVFPVANESELNERIFNLIGAWHNPNTPAGVVARASMERWGVPLRPEDVAELEYREWFIEHNGPRIQEWGEATYPATYGGYWVDHRGGGKIRVGFVGGSAGPLSQLKAAPGLVAIERLAPFAHDPSTPASALVSLQVAIGANNAANPPLRGLITGVGIDIPSNRVTVGATDVAAVTQGLTAAYGSAAPFAVHYEPPPQGPTSRRHQTSGPVYGGQVILKQTSPEPEDKYRGCTAAFGAREKVGTKANGQPEFAHFVLTAGHCFTNGDTIKRALRSDNETIGFYAPKPIGEQRSRLWQPRKDGGELFEHDGAAVRLNSPDFVTNKILAREGGFAQVDGVGVAELGMSLCVSLGFTDAVRCQPLRNPAVLNPGFGYEQTGAGPFWQLSLLIDTEDGDSGSPVWSPKTDKAIAIHVYGDPSQSTPLLPPPLPKEGPFPWGKPERSDAVGLLNEPFMDDVHVVKR